MNPTKIALSFILSSIIILFLGLIFYGNALTLNQEKHRLSIDIKRLKKQTQRLDLVIRSKKNLKNIENYARTQLDMMPASKIIYLDSHE